MSTLAPFRKKENISLGYALVKTVFPMVDQELAGLKDKVASSPDPELREQGLASIRLKRFHALGGSFYSLYPENRDRKALVEFITAYQTISDYLDNLCDRAGVLDEKAFRQLHESMLVALKPHAPHKDYYLYYPHKEDGGYLEELVHRCQNFLQTVPSYPLVMDDVVALSTLYGDLQVYKHLQRERRVPLLSQWHKKKGGGFPLFWWEFAAASGSTLGVFALVAAALQEEMARDEADAIKTGYFPWISGLHILLDYYIDQEEDLREGDLNLVHFYASPHTRMQRIKWFLDRAWEEAGKLPHPSFHRLAIQGLLAMYLSDDKIKEQGLEKEAGFLLHKGGLETKVLHTMCHLLRANGAL
jgi:tetraprenyl-beta-curcumene synthase